MRTIVIAMLAAAGIGLIGTSGASATVANGSAILNAASATLPIEQVQYYGGYYGYGYRPRRYCWREQVCDYYGRCYYVRKCNY